MFEKIKTIFAKKCYFHMNCELYDSTSLICENGGGIYCGKWRYLIRN